MPKRPHDVTDAELAVLRALWELGPTTIRTLTDELYPDGGAAHYATVQKLLERLEAKECVTRDRSTVPHVFAARVARDDLISRQLDDLADKLCDGAVAPLLTSLVNNRRLSSKDRRALRSLVDALDAANRKPRGGRRS